MKPSISFLMLLIALVSQSFGQLSFQTFSQASLPPETEAETETEAANLDEYRDHFGVISTGFSFTTKDVFWEVGASYLYRPLNVEAGIWFHRRLGNPKVLVEVDDNFYYQFHERRYMMSAGVTKYFEVVNPIALYVGFRGGFFWTNYRGTVIEPENNKWAMIPAVGARIGSNFARLKIGAEFMSFQRVQLRKFRIFIGGQFVF